jgi:hypothetical protein
LGHANGNQSEEHEIEDVDNFTYGAQTFEGMGLIVWVEE